MRTDLFDFDLPPELIAQTPLARGESRLLVLHRETGKLEHRVFSDLPEYLNEGDTLVLNDTRVSARRLKATREGGEEAEILLLRPCEVRSWEALVKPGRALKPGKILQILGENDLSVTAVVLSSTPEGGRILQFESERIRNSLKSWGVSPLPPYINTSLHLSEEERYQTVYGTMEGSAAAPTAGLHFTPEMLDKVKEIGVSTAKVTLHVGVGTFRPVRTETLEAHEMHSETAFLSAETAEIINRTSGTIVAVGTTSVRTLETAAKFAQVGNRVGEFAGETNIFLSPGSRFIATDKIITNFHLPKSTLIMLVCAFAGHEFVLEAYREAVRERYRFFSFGDAMLIL